MAEQDTITITDRTQYMHIAIKQVKEHMSKLPMSAENTVVKLLMVAFDTGYQLAKLGEAEVEL